MKSSPSLEADTPDAITESVFAAFDKLVPDNGPLAIGVSGGSDSLALLKLAKAWAHVQNREVIAATLDHGLRPEAKDEAAYVASFCAQWTIPHTTLTWDQPTPKQANARLARYQHLADWATQNQARAIAIGHTRDDRIETFLLRTRAGSSWYGLAGPMPRAPLPISHANTDLHLIRPLLNEGRETLQTYLTHQNIHWINDPSNDDHKFERVRMRALTQYLDTQTKTRTLNAMNRFAEMRAAIISGVREFNQTEITWSQTSATMNAVAFAALPKTTAQRLLEALILALTGQTTPPRSSSLQSLLAHITQPKATTKTLAGCRFTSTRNNLLVDHAPPRRNQKSSQVPLNHASAKRMEALLISPQTRILNTPTPPKACP